MKNDLYAPLIEACIPMAQAVCRGMSRRIPRELWDDCNSAAMESLCHAIYSYDPEKGPFDNWVRSKVQFGILQFLSTEPEWTEADIEDIEQPGLGVAETVILADCLEQAFACMTPAERLCLKMYVDGFRTEEIEDCLGMSKYSVWKTLSRARAKAKSICA